MSYEIVKRCTRDGVTSWQNVAAQIGCSVDEARRRFDVHYVGTLPVRTFRGSCTPVLGAEGHSEPEGSTRSPHAKGPGKKHAMLLALQRHKHMTVSELGAVVGSPCNSVRARLAALREAGLVENDNLLGKGSGKLAWTWRLTEAGKRHLKKCAEGDRAAA